MPFPTHLEDFLKAGYKLGNFSVCKKCHAEIIWTETPNGRAMPIDPIPVTNKVTAHFATCAFADSFRKKGWKIGPASS